MSEVKLTKGLKATLGEQNIGKINALSELLEKTEGELGKSDYSNIPDSLLVSILRKRRKLNQFLGQVMSSNKKSGLLEKRSNEIKESMKELIGEDVEKFQKELEEEIKAVKTVMDQKAKEVAVKVNEETVEIADSVDTRISEDIDLVKQQKQEHFEVRTQLMKKWKELDQKYNKAMVEYEKKKGFFANFREARSKVDEKTGKKLGLFASVKAAFNAAKENKSEEVDKQHQAELDAIFDQITEVENEIATCDTKIVALSEQRKSVKQEIVKENTMIANALKAHLDNAKSHQVEYEGFQLGLEEEIERLENLKQSADKDNLELATEIKNSEETIEYLRSLAQEAQKMAESEKAKSEPTVENVLGEIDKNLTELREQKRPEDYNERMKIEEQIYELEEQQRDIMDPIVLDEHKELYGEEEKAEPEVSESTRVEEMVEEVVENETVESVKEAVAEEPSIEDKETEEKKEVGYKELNARYNEEMKERLFIVDKKLEAARGELKNVRSRAEKQKLEQEIKELEAKKAEYERPLTRRETYRRAREHFDMDR